MHSNLLLVFFCVFQFIFVIVNSLDPSLWDVKNSNSSIQLKVHVPGGIYTDYAQANSENPDIFYRFNDVNYRWIARENWTYSLPFSATRESDLERKKEFIFHGLDGIATILLNNHTIGKAINTFVRYRFDVTELLQDGANILEVQFESPITSGHRLAAESSHPVPPNCQPPDYHGECHVNFLRRMPASFSWDWGLAAPSVGIWKPVELITYYRDLIVRDVTTNITFEQKQFKVTINVYCEGPLHSNVDINGAIKIKLQVEDGESIETSTPVSLKSSEKNREIVTTSTIYVQQTRINLWWPNGYGKQHLYDLVVTFENEYNAHSRTISIGFRQIKVIEDPIEYAQGRHFYFEVNGFPIFAKGTNYIPHSIFLEKSGDRSTIRSLVLAMKEANMNMVRVWGGGIYPDDFFFEQCDRLGIMVWQDMMFACSMYPVDDAFLSNVENEIGQQIKRLQHHASIALWAGNNENEVALGSNWYNTNLNFELFRKEYIKLYIDTVRETVLRFDDTRRFLVSSPTNGIESENKGYIADNPYDPLYGDIHFYDYKHDSWLTDHYPMTRFSSEYGFQSLPSLSSLKKIAAPEDLQSLSSKFFQHRQHQPIGYVYMAYQLVIHFGAPSLEDLTSIIYISQIGQAWAVKLQTEWYRQWQGRSTRNGEGFTMGAMYWQLNDVWQAPSWSSIEFGGKWKMLHYWAKKFFAPLITTAHIRSDGEVSISVVSDLTYDMPVTIKEEIFSWDSFEPEFPSRKKEIIAKKGSAQGFLTESIEKYMSDYGRCQTNHTKINTKCFVRISLMHNDTLIHENFLLPSPPRLIENLQTATIKTNVDCSSTCSILVETNVISLFVWLDVGDIPGHFSDNGFIMVERQKRVEFYPEEYITPDTLNASLTITVLDKKRMDTFLYLSNPYSTLKSYFINSKMH